MTVVYTLLVVVLGNSGPATYSRMFATEFECKIAQMRTHESAQEALAVIDVGTLCVKSELNPDRKPRV